MDSSHLSLPSSTEKFLQSHNGPLTVAGQKGSYVLMRAEVYDAMLGICEQEEAETLASVQRGLADMQAGRTKDVDVLFDELDSRDAS